MRRVAEAKMVEYLLTVILELCLKKKHSTYPNYFLLGTRIDFCYILVGMFLFPLKDFLMRLYPKQVLDDAKRIFEHKSSRTRGALQNFFGICSSRFLLKPIIDNLKYIVFLTKAWLWITLCLTPAKSCSKTKQYRALSKILIKILFKKNIINPFATNT